jgi:hypothetical protein
MDLASGYSDSINYGNGYTPLANNAIANNNADYARNQAAIALMAQQYQNQFNADLAAHGPSSGYGTVGGYPSFGDPGNYGPGSGLSPFSGTPLGGNPSGDVQRGPDLQDLSVNPFKDQSQMPVGNRNPVQGGPDIGPFWQGIRDLAGADPKDQSRVPNAFGTGADAFNMYGMSPGDMATWTRAMQSAGRGGEIPQQPAQPAQDPYYWSGNFFGANDGKGIGQGEGMGPGMGGFNNPAVPTSPQQWYANGGYNPYDPQTYGGAAQQNVGTGQPNVSNTQNSVFDTGTTPYQTYGGADDMDWMRGGSQGPRPSSVAGWGGSADQAWYSSGAQGARPSTLYDPKNLWGGIYDQDWVKGGSEGVRPSTVAGWGNTEDQDWVYKHGSVGPRPSTVANWGGADDQAWYGHGAEGIRPSLDAYYGSSDATDFSALRRNTKPFGSEATPFAHYNMPTGDTLWDNNPTGSYYEFKPGTGLEDKYNPLIQQRAGFKERLAADPDARFNTAAKLVQELQNDPTGRTALYEAMLNRYNATGQDPLNPGYYPTDKVTYNNTIVQRLKDNPDFLNQVYGEMDQVYGGSNLSNYATDWGSADVAADANKYATPTWKSPVENEQFYRKDINVPYQGTPSWAGEGIANQNKAWYTKAQQPLWPGY